MNPVPPAPQPDPTRKPLAGETVVFTGRLSSLGRRQARALVVDLGGEVGNDVTAKTTTLVVGAEGFPALPARALSESLDGGGKSNKLKRAEQLNARGETRIRILGEPEFCRLAGLTGPDELKLQYYAQRDLLAMYPTVREDQIRYLQKWGLVRPVLRTHSETYHSFSGLLVIRQVAGELARGVPFRNVLRALQGQRSGQLTLDLRLDTQPARVIRLNRITALPGPEGQAGRPIPARPASAVAEEYFLQGSALDLDEARRDEAAEWYRRALQADPYLVEALINLANIHYGRGDLVEAQALLEQAATLDPDSFEAHFNLGNIHHDLGRFPEASACYRRALALTPEFADAHFYLAVTLEKMGQSAEAKPHWRAYQKLAPDGEWVELAREFSD
jgi:tetratricopeptide (TPR) repeat protein